MLNVFIYDNSRTHRNKLEKIIRDYTKNKNIELVIVTSTARPSKIINLLLTKLGLYLINIDDLEEKMDGINFALNIRNNDLYGSIVFLTEHDIFETNRSNLAVCSLKRHVAAMSFLAKDSVEYENEIKKSIAVHIRKISMLLTY